MRQEHETATSFNQLKELTQAIQALKKPTPKKNATNQASENANISDLMQATGSKPKSSAQAKKGVLNPTKKAFSERQITAFRDNSQASELKRLQTNQANNSSLRAKPSGEAFKQGLKNKQRGQK
ncbi:hypothetical protein [Helicobacter pylori]|uniref:hypothetical protein n=1 Tax=Helicobacter pylori TaxID=210 RepID=UPI002711F344|nr:hypothetical protein [Helicobacter pylori]MDO7813919.1 hypothetical protein [Helicobacter pylori]WQU30717.1 hypothetical protein KVC17_00985 [Helicobacter pylori]